MIPAGDGVLRSRRDARHTRLSCPAAAFRFCPRCGQGPVDGGEAPVFACAACGFHYHFNPAVAAGVIVEDGEGRVLLVRRAKEPARGLLGVPGGFVDVGESAEEAARREAREETGLEVEGLGFLGSWPNLYEWRGVAYPVVDLYFSGRDSARVDGLAPRHEVDEVLWLRPEEVDPATLAFPTTQGGLRPHREGGSRPRCRLPSR